LSPHRRTNVGGESIAQARYVKAVLMRTAQRLPVYEENDQKRSDDSLRTHHHGGAGQLNTSAAVTVAKAIRTDADRARAGENLITARNVTYSSLGLTSPIAGKACP